MREETLRLFIALNVDRTARREIVRLQEKLWGKGAKGLSRPENLHLTLAFLGETAPDRVEAVRRAMDRTGGRPPELIFDRVGAFRRDGGDVWWLGMEENRALCELHKRLSRALRQEEFQLEERKFVAHLTLARRTRPERLPTRERLDQPIRSHAPAVSLMRSQRLDGRLVYTELYHTH